MKAICEAQTIYTCFELLETRAILNLGLSRLLSSCEVKCRLEAYGCSSKTLCALCTAQECFLGRTWYSVMQVASFVIL